MNIGIIGAGQIGATLAKHFRQVGHSVRIGNSRGPESLAELARELDVTPVAVADAGKQVDVLVITIPLKAVPELPHNLLSGFPEDGIIIDTCNYYPWFRDGQIAAIDNGMTESEWVSQQVGRDVMKVFNNISAVSLAKRMRPSGHPDRIALPVAGGPAAAKARVIALLDAIGFDGFDAGTLQDSWRQEPGTPAYCTNHTLTSLPGALAAAKREIQLEMSKKGIEIFMRLPEGASVEDGVRELREMWTNSGR